jgi:hypothetical protein
VRVFFAVLAMGFVRAEAEPPPVPPQITVEYHAPTGAEVIGPSEQHVARMRALIWQFEAQIRQPEPLKIVYQQCGSANAYYRPWIHSIVLCHELWDKRRALYLQTGHRQQLIDRRLDNAMTFSAFHELGHALHDQFALPLLGNEEDAVDELATMWMIRLGVGDAAKAGAYGHHLRGNQPEYDNSPWDDHPNAQRRGYAIACLLYGVDPDRYGDVLHKMNVPKHHIERCRDEYAERLVVWQKLMGPYLSY